MFKRGRNNSCDISGKKISEYDLPSIVPPWPFKHFIILFRLFPLTGSLIFCSCCLFSLSCEVLSSHTARVIFLERFPSLNTGQSASQTKRCHWWLSSNWSHWELPPIHLLSQLYGHNCHRDPPKSSQRPLWLLFGGNIPIVPYFLRSLA